MSPVSESLVFPIGHYLGANYLDEGGDLDAHVLRIGWRLHRVADGGPFMLWALAHGVPEGEVMKPWTLDSVEGAARAGGVQHADDLLEELLQADLLVEVDLDDTDDAVELAQACRLRSLLSGLGESPDEPDRLRIGLVPDRPAIEVGGLARDLWTWGPACDSLWHACEVMAAAHPDAVHAHDLLVPCLRAAQVLIAHGAAYLDEARDEWDHLTEEHAQPAGA